jgi:hypothetical protein
MKDEGVSWLADRFQDTGRSLPAKATVQDTKDHAGLALFKRFGEIAHRQRCIRQVCYIRVEANQVPVRRTMPGESDDQDVIL